ncbi:MAG: lipoyl synthase [Candidatus Heimdallarchaeota archaeon]|nr:lipoyl synthase [Candidatus Heimdallarchaeota archaeon]MDH5645461.1 lipoyl synthase [Candidatus Heimdallarchaeota archaeon]
MRKYIPDPAGKAPDFIRFKGKTFSKTLNVVNSSVKRSTLSTVCEEASCPNKTECWSGGTATFMLMGDTCTRGCGFCNVKTSRTPDPLDPLEGEKLVQALASWNITYIVITSVDRDDLPDGGAQHLADCIALVKSAYPSLLIEILIPDFNGRIEDIRKIVDAKPDVIAHNIETVKRLTPKVRDRRASYQQSLTVLKSIKQLDADIKTKSSIMLGLSETEEEVSKTMYDLREVGVDFLTIGQYMRPSFKHLPVKEYLPLDVYKNYENIGMNFGFIFVASGPLVRSSYRAGEFYIENYLRSSISG